MIIHCYAFIALARKSLEHHLSKDQSDFDHLVQELSDAQDIKPESLCQDLDRLP